MFIGVRGSGEDDGYGPTVTAVRDGLVARWNQTHTGSAGVRQVWLDYPAVAPQTLEAEGMEALLFGDLGRTKYFASTQTGSSELVRLLDDNARRCPTETVLLAGFSQGASVITHALASPGVDTTKVGAAILVGNPGHYPKQQVTESDPSVDKEAVGLEALLRYLRFTAASQPNRQTAVDAMIARIFAIQQDQINDRELDTAMAANTLALPSSLAGRVFSVCKAGDLICDSSAGMARIMTGTTTLDQEIDRTRPIHGHYVAADLVTTLNAAVQQLPEMPNPLKQSEPEQPHAAEPAPGRWPVVVGVVLVGAAALFAAITLTRRRRSSRLR